MGLFSLATIQQLHIRSDTTNFLNSKMLAQDTVLASWAWPQEDSDMIQKWLISLKSIGITPELKITNQRYIHVGCKPTNKVWQALYRVGIFAWASIEGQSRADRERWIRSQVCREVFSEQEFNDLEDTRTLVLRIRGVRGIQPSSEHLDQLALGEDEHNYKWDYLTWLIRVWTDGGYKDHSTTAGVFFSKSDPSLNHRISIQGNGSSFIGELVGIKEAIHLAPKNHNLEIITDSKSTIDAITNFPIWSWAKCHKTDGCSIIKDIHAFLAVRKEISFITTFSYIPSHINDKRLEVGNQGEEAVAALEEKLLALG